MPRPKLVSDPEVLDATRRVMLRVGAGEMTLSDVAAEVGLSRAALIQRFESKAGLARHLMAHERAGLAALIAADPITNKGPQQALGFLDKVLESLACPVLLSDPEGTVLLREAIAQRLDEPSRQRAGDVADLLMTVLRGASAEPGGTGHVAARLHLALKLVYAGAPAA